MRIPTAHRQYTTSNSSSNLTLNRTAILEDISISQLVSGQSAARILPSRSRNSNNNPINVSESVNVYLRQAQSAQQSQQSLHQQNQNQSQHMIMSPSVADDNRLFSPQHRDIYSPNNNSISNQALHMTFNPSNQHQHGFQDRELAGSNSLQNRNLRLRLADIRSNDEMAIDIVAQKAGNSGTTQTKQLEQLDKMQKFALIVLQQTFFNHVSLQLFFLLVLLVFLEGLNTALVFVYLLALDVISYYYSHKRSKIEVQIDQLQDSRIQRIWSTVESFFSVIFKICFYIFLEVTEYKFYYIPCFLLLYIIIRFFFVISRRLQENWSISALLNESFIWGFKIFFIGQIFLVAIKLNNQIDWTWSSVFWPYWVFFYIMIGSTGIITVFWLSKIVLKCLGQPVQPFEVKGLFWFLILSSGLCVNSTLFVKGIVSFLDESTESDAQIAFRINFGYILVFVIFTVYFWKSIWVFIVHFSKEKEETDAADISVADKEQATSKRKKNKSTLVEGRVDEEEEDADDDKSDDEEDAEEQDAYADDENYPEEQIQGDSNSAREQSLQNAAQLRAQQQQEQQSSMSHNPGKNQKVFKKVSLMSKEHLKKNIPQFLERLSSTYFTALTNYAIKFKKQTTNQVDLNDGDVKGSKRPSTSKRRQSKKKGDGQSKSSQNKSEKESGSMQHISNNNSQSIHSISNNIGNQRNESIPDKERVKRSAKDQPIGQDDVEGKLTSITSKEIETQNKKGAELGPNSCDDSHSNCLICFENEPDTVFLPCGHGGICYECGMDVIQRTGECYLCRNAVESVVQIDVKGKEAQKKVIAITAAFDDKGEGSQQTDKSVDQQMSEVLVNGDEKSDRLDNVGGIADKEDSQTIQVEEVELQLQQRQGELVEEEQREGDEKEVAESFDMNIPDVEKNGVDQEGGVGIINESEEPGSHLGQFMPRDESQAEHILVEQQAEIIATKHKEIIDFSEDEDDFIP